MRIPKTVLTAARAACATFAVWAGLLVPAARAGELRRGEEVTVERALDGDTLALAGGRVLRLAGVLAPKPGDRGARRDLERAAAEARAALDRLARGKRVRLWHGDHAADRHGRILAYARVEDSAWLQEEMLRRGHARVFTQPGVAARAAAMLKIEAEARAARRGLWALAAYAVRGDGEAGRHTESFQLVEGRVLKAASARGIYYLNFGADYRRDFTIGLDRAALRAFRRGGLDPAALAGKRVRVRGWVLWRNGPYIAATHPEQVEVLDQAAAPGTRD